MGPSISPSPPLIKGAIAILIKKDSITFLARYDVYGRYSAPLDWANGNRMGLGPHTSRQNCCRAPHVPRQKVWEKGESFILVQ
ncbi:hypothetical protein YC2023_088373 [Brassica napus]